MNSIEAAKLWGHVPYTPTDGCGFVLPVFSANDGQTLWAQEPDLSSERIVGFFPLERDASEKVVETASKLECRSGGPLIFGFSDQEGRVQFGSLAELHACLTNFMAESDDISTNLQIAELIGSKSQRQQQRTAMIDLVRGSVGENSAENFGRTSILLSTIWSSLLKHANNSPEVLKSLSDRQRWILLSADHSLEGLFPLNVMEWLRDEISVDLTRLLRDIREETPEALAAHHDIKPSVLQEQIRAEIESITSEPRQEARIAKIIRRMMESPGMGRHLLMEYTDRAGFARKIIKLLQTHSRYFELGPAPDFIQWLMHEVFTISYPRQRGVLLYELANHLSEYPIFADAIRSLTHHSNSEAVRFAREEIIERLENPGPAVRSKGPLRPEYHYVRWVR